MKKSVGIKPKSLVEAETVSVQMVSGIKIEMPIIERISIGGIEGFALHRPICRGLPLSSGWAISHIETGLVLIEYHRRKDVAIIKAGELMRMKCGNDPEVFKRTVKGVKRRVMLQRRRQWELTKSQYVDSNKGVREA